MADQKLSELTDEATTLAADDRFYVVQGGDSKYAEYATILQPINDLIPRGVFSWDNSCHHHTGRQASQHAIGGTAQ
jgi:hypothetical protein